ncbi:MAG: hypothetical protein ACREFA_08340 [Stellaceae bacterium]
MSEIADRIFAKLDGWFDEIAPPLTLDRMIAAQPALAPYRGALGGLDIADLLVELLLVGAPGRRIEAPAGARAPVAGVLPIVENWLRRHAAQHRALAERDARGAPLH